MEAACSSETSIDFQENARHVIPQDGTFPLLIVNPSMPEERKGESERC
jgi:hypothetical protein